MQTHRALTHCAWTPACLPAAFNADLTDSLAGLRCQSARAAIDSFVRSFLHWLVHCFTAAAATASCHWCSYSSCSSWRWWRRRRRFHVVSSKWIIRAGFEISIRFVEIWWSTRESVNQRISESANQRISESAARDFVVTCLVCTGSICDECFAPPAIRRRRCIAAAAASAAFAEGSERAPVTQ